MDMHQTLIENDLFNIRNWCTPLKGNADCLDGGRCAINSYLLMHLFITLGDIKTIIDAFIIFENDEIESSLG